MDTPPKQSVKELRKLFGHSSTVGGKSQDASKVNERISDEPRKAIEKSCVTKDGSKTDSVELQKSVKELRTLFGHSSTSKGIPWTASKVRETKSEDRLEPIGQNIDTKDKDRNVSKVPRPSVQELRILFGHSSTVKGISRNKSKVHKTKSPEVGNAVDVERKDERKDISEALCFPILLFRRDERVKVYSKWFNHFHESDAKGQSPYFVIMSCSSMTKHADRVGAFVLGCMKRMSLKGDRETVQCPPHCKHDIPGIYLWHCAFQININSRTQVPTLYMARRGADLSIDDKTRLLGFAVAATDLLIYFAYRRITGADLWSISNAICYPPTNPFMGRRRKKLLILVSDWIDPEHFPYGPDGGMDYIIYILTLPNLDERDSLARKHILTTFGIPDCILLPSKMGSRSHGSFDDKHSEDECVRRAIASFATGDTSHVDSLKRIQEILLVIDRR